MIILLPFILLFAYFLFFAVRDHTAQRATNTAFGINLYPAAVGGPVDTQETGEQRFTCLQFVFWPLLVGGLFWANGTAVIPTAQNGMLDQQIWVGFAAALIPAVFIAGLQRRTQWGDGAGHLAEIMHGSQIDPAYRNAEITRMTGDRDWSEKFPAAGDRTIRFLQISDYLDRPDIRFVARIMYALGRMKIGRGSANKT